MQLMPMRTHFRSVSFRPRRILRGVLLFVGLIAVFALAFVGAAIALAVLAIGALMHGVVTLLRSTPAARPVRREQPAVIEGEFRVVDGGPLSGLGR